MECQAILLKNTMGVGKMVGEYFIDEYLNELDSKDGMFKGTTVIDDSEIYKLKEELGGD